VFALATNAVIHALKGTGAVRQRLQAMDANDLAAPAIVVYELEFGALASNASQRRKDLAGIKIGPLDTLIAGTALVHNAVLVSHNIREFSRVQGLQVEDWL
jgi:tRNA(fMet)-specific endonuclease VapC